MEDHASVVGQYERKNMMKYRLSQLLSILLVLSLLFGAVGCKAGQKKPAEDAKAEVSPETTVAVEEEAAPAEEAPAEEEEATPVEEEEAPAEEEEAEVAEDEAPAEEETADEAEAADEESSEEETPAEEEAAEEEAVEEETADEEAAESEDSEDKAEDETAAEEEEAAEEEADEAPAEEVADEESEEEAEEAPADEDAEEADEDSEGITSGLRKLPALDGNAAAMFMLEKGFKVYDITKIQPLAVKQAIFGANYDPQSLALGLKYLQQSGVFDPIMDEEKPGSFNTDLDFGALFNQIPLDMIFKYLNHLELNLYSVFYLTFPDTETAQKAFYTGNGIIELTDEQKVMVKEGLDSAKEQSAELQAEAQKQITKFMLENPEQAAQAVSMLQEIISKISAPEWVTKEDDRLVRKITLELPFGKVFIEEAQHDTVSLHI